MTAQPPEVLPDVLQSLLRAVRAMERPPAPQAVDFDWSRPSRYPAEALRRLESFGRRCATAVADALELTLLSRPGLELSGLEQVYREQAARDLAEQGGYAFALDDASGPCGMLVVSAATALEWVDRLLGGVGTVDEEARALTPMETDVVVDAATAVVGAIGQVAERMGAQPLTCGPARLAEDLSLDDAAPAEYCRFGIADATQQARLTLLMPSEWMDAVAARRGLGESDPARAAADIRVHLREAVVPVSACLGTVELTTRDLVGLQPGDVLLLTQDVDAPVRLSVQGRAVRAANPVRCGGQYALQLLALGA